MTYLQVKNIIKIKTVKCRVLARGHRRGFYLSLVYIPNPHTAINTIIPHIAYQVDVVTEKRRYEDRIESFTSSIITTKRSWLIQLVYINQESISTLWYYSISLK